VHTVIVDEWHELIGNKRGVQVQLALARLRRWNPGLVVWGLSATLGNLDEAMATLVGADAPATAPPLVQGRVDKPSSSTPCCRRARPLQLGRPPGRADAAAGGATRSSAPGTTLVFTNTRSQAEIWYQLLLEERPDWAGLVALHHGSLDKGVREWVEAGLKAGHAEGRGGHLVAGPGRGLPAGGARAADRQRQGRGAAAAARRPQRPRAGPAQPRHAGAHQHAGAGGGRGRAPRRAGRPVEPRRSPEQAAGRAGAAPGDGGLGGGFEAGRRRAVRRGAQRPGLPRARARPSTGRWPSCERGGDSLTAYPEYHRIACGVDGRWRVPDRGIARRHRLQVGTIVSDASMQVKWLSGGGTLGTSRRASSRG
jgi:ATP-dependent helicase Lhr and Lhr-like helicase